MKKLLLSLATLVALTSFSQVSIQISENGNNVVANGTVHAVTSASSNTKVYFDVKNTSGATKSYKAKRYDVSLNTVASTTAEAYFCFAGSCYGSSTYTAGTLILNAGQRASELSGSYNMLIADLDEASAVGISIVKYSFINVNTISDSVQVTIAYNQPAGIHETNNVISSFELSPNPVNESATIKINSAKAIDGKFLIYNALGAVVNEKTVSLNEGKNKIDFSAETLSSGIYFASLKFGNTTTTKKFVVK
jgi:hypothetical protein